VYKVVRLYETNSRIPKTESYGSVDVRLGTSESIEESSAAQKSLEAFGLDETGKFLIRLVTIPNSPELGEAIKQSRILFEETVDLLLRQIMADVKSCGDSGYFVDLETGIVTPFLPQPDTSFKMGNLFRIGQGVYPRINAQQFVAAGRDDELIKAYLRSINWFNKSRTQNREYLRFLFTWISLETVSKIDENESIVPKICLALGFPLGNDHLAISTVTTSRLNQIQDYKIWKAFILKHMEESRDLRNKIVHSGFKETDLAASEIRTKMYILGQAYNSMISYLENIILSGETVISSAWQKMRHQLEMNENLANHVEGNLIYSLAHPEMLDFLEKRETS